MRMIDSPSSRAHLLHAVAERAALLAAGAGQRLVEHEDRRVGGQHGGHLDHLERAVGQPADAAVAEVGEAHEVEDVIGPLPQEPLLAQRARRADDRGQAARPDAGVLGDDEVLEHGEAAHEPDLLERAPEAPLGPRLGLEVGDVLAEQAHAAAVRASRSPTRS